MELETHLSTKAKFEPNLNSMIVVSHTLDGPNWSESYILTNHGHNSLRMLKIEGNLNLGQFMLHKTTLN